MELEKLLREMDRAESRLRTAADAIAAARNSAHIEAPSKTTERLGEADRNAELGCLALVEVRNLLTGKNKP